MPDKIRVRLLTHASGPNFSIAPGMEAELEREQAEAMLAGGFAERVEEPEESMTDRTQQLAPPAPEPEPGPAVVETATAPPQRSQEADDLVAAERAGAAAAAAGEERRVPDGMDGRSARGRAWYRGYDSHGQEYRVSKSQG
jgi:hypothetical protein